MANSDCLFCKFVSGEIAVNLVLESELAIAFDDIDPKAPTHTLVIPKAHFVDVIDLAQDSASLTAVMQLAAQVAAQKGLAGGFRLVFNTGADGGQSVFHAHGHVLGGRSLQWPPG